MKARDSDVLIGYAKVAGLSRDAFQRCSGIPKRTFERRRQKHKAAMRKAAKKMSR